MGLHIRISFVEPQIRQGAMVMERSLAIAKSAFKLAGFEVVGRIVLRNVRTGRIYR